MRSILRSVGAVLAGVLTGVILSLGSDTALRSIGIFPPLGQTMSDGLFLLATVYRTVYGIVGSYVTARLASGRPMYHAMVLGVLGFVVSVVGAVATWNSVPSLGPHWYPVALVVLAIPAAWAGGWLRVTELRRSRLAHGTTATSVNSHVC